MSVVRKMLGKKGRLRGCLPNNMLETTTFSRPALPQHTKTSSKFPVASGEHVTFPDLSFTLTMGILFPWQVLHVGQSPRVGAFLPCPRLRILGMFPPMGFTYHETRGKIYHEPNLCRLQGV